MNPNHCPKCGALGHWMTGVHFDHQMKCNPCDNIWEPLEIKMMIKYVVGDATDPQGPGKKIIVHCCNDEGGWGSGFVLALDKRWMAPGAYYRRWAQVGRLCDAPFKLGQVLVVPISGTNIGVANLIGQSGCGDYYGLPPVRYGAVEEGLIRLREKMRDSAWSLHMPRMCCGLAGGNWAEIEKIIERVFKDSSVPITIYDLPENSSK